MPEEEKKTVDIDTSGPGAEIDIEETKDEAVVETEAPKQEEAINETDKTEPSTEILYKDWDNKRNCMRLLLFTVEKDSINRHGEKAKLR